MAQKYSKQQIMNMIVEEAKRQGVDPRLALAVAQQESGYNSRAKSKVGAMGIMQLMPNTAKGLGVTDPYNPQQNIRGGITLLRGLVKKYGNDTPRVLAAYNAGSGAVDDYLYGTNKTGQNPKRRKNAMPYDGTGYKETKGYVNNILGFMNDVNSGVNKFIKDHPVIYGAGSGAIGGAGLGFALGGPVGAAVGAVRGGVTGGIAGWGLGNARNIKDAFQRGYEQQSDQILNPDNITTGQAANLPEQSQSGYELLKNVELPKIDITVPDIGSPSGISTEQIAKNIISDLPTQFEQARQDYIMGYITPEQFFAMYPNELSKEGINSAKDLKTFSRFTPQALTEADRIAKDIAVTPEQINKVQQQGAEEIAEQRKFAAQQGQGMVDRLNAIQQQYNDIINSDPRLQTGQGYYIDPRDVESNLRSQLANQAGGYGMKLPTAEEIAAQRYYAQRSNQLGVPYADYLAAKQNAITNQMKALNEYQQLQGNINTSQASMANELSKVVQKLNEGGIGALTENEKQLVELYKGVLSNMTTGEYGVQKDISNRYRDIAGDRVQGLNNLYTTDVGAMTTTTGNVLQNQANQQRNMYGYLTDAQGNYIRARQLPYQNFSYLGQGLGYAQMGGLTPQQSQALLQGFTGVQVPQQETYQPQGLQWR